MKITAIKGLAATAGICGGIAMLPGCSGPQEDVRITFCKNLTAKLLEPVNDFKWQPSEQQLKSPEYARITVYMNTMDQSGKEMSLQASCFYAYDAVDDNAMNLSNPLSAYASVPYQVILNERTLSGPALQESIRQVQLAMGQEVVEKTRQAVSDGIQQVKKGIENMREK